MEHLYLDDEALEASDLNCFITPPIGNSDVSILDLSERLSLTSMPKPNFNFWDKVKALVGKKTCHRASKTLLQQIQAGHLDEARELSSVYRKTRRVWAFKIIPCNKGKL